MVITWYNACTWTDSAWTGICWVLKSWCGHSYLPRLISLQRLTHQQQILIPNCLPSHPPFPQEDQLQETGTICATNPKIGSRQQWHEPVSTLYLITHLPNLRPLVELETDSREEKQFSAQIRHPSRGTGRFWLTRDGGGEKNTRWNHSYLKGWADGRKPCHWLNFGKHGLLCKVIPTLYLHSSQDTGCGCGCLLRSYMLTLESTEFKIQIAITYYSDFPLSIL